MSGQKWSEVNARASDVVQALVAWFVTHERELPWREQPPNPYRVWLGETMSQQTTMAVVRGYFARFTQQFPTVESLAQATEQQVLTAWAGLGYYSRAKNLWQGARQIAANGMPQTYTEWLAIAGVGPYTAAAVSSICFGEKKGVVDGNVIRVLSRFLYEPIEHWTSAGKARLQNVMDTWVQVGEPGLLNQAVMELGQFVCVREKPLCGECPIAKWCGARKHQSQQSLPLTKPRRKIESWTWQVDWIEKNGKVFLVKNQGQLPVLKDTWVFPGQARRSAASQRHRIIHTITHHQWSVEIKNRKVAPKVEGRWVPIAQLPEVNPSQFLVKIAKLAARPAC